MLLYVCCCRCWLTFPCGRSYIYRSLCSGDTSLVWREVAAHTVSRAEKTSRDSRESFLSADSARDESLSFFHSAPEHISHMCLRSTLDAGGLKAAPPPRTTYAPWGMLRLRPASATNRPTCAPRGGCNGQRHLLPLTLFKLVRLNYPPSERQASSFDSL